MVNWKENNYPFKKFTEALTQEWIDCGFSKKETREWLESGLQPNNARFAQWLKNIKGKDAEWFSNCSQEEELRKEFEKKNSKNNDQISDCNGLEITKVGFYRCLENELQDDPEWFTKNPTFPKSEIFKERYLEHINKTLINSNKPLTLQEWLNSNYPTRTEKELVKTINIYGKKSLGNIDLEGGELDLSEYANLEKVKIVGKYLEKSQTIKLLTKPLTNLILGNKPKLKALFCDFNQLTNLNLINCLELVELCCRANSLSSLDFLNHLDSKNLEVIDISFNNLPDDLTTFSKFVNLKILFLNDNPFYGSLKPLQNLNKLKILEISHTNIDSGLEYLPDSIENLICYAWKTDFDVQKIRNLLTNEQGIVEEDNWGVINFPQKLKSIKEQIKNNKTLTNRVEKNSLNVIPIKMVDGFIDYLFKEKNEKEYESKENYDLEDLIDEYKEIELQNREFVFWKPEFIGRDSPIKLIDLNKAKIDNLEEIKAEEIENLRKQVVDFEEVVRAESKINNFAMLSYVWGKSEEGKVLSLGGKKSLIKAIKALETINKENKKKQGETIRFLWMDQLCIDQNNLEEKNQEVPKMGRYYNESLLTLISINFKIKNWIESRNCKDDKEKAEKIMRKIIKSEWFTRSWTFQEGLLSKQTIFMFNDCLVDGRVIAETFVRFTKIDLAPISEKNEHCKYATLFGLNFWNYSMTEKTSDLLPNLLIQIKDRKRSIPADGIYSLLGALPYGHLAKPRYKKFGEKYTKEELEEILLEVMKVGVENGYAEPLAWEGIRRKEPWLWWMPEMDENGSTTGLHIGTFIAYKLESSEFTENGVKLFGSRHVVSSLKRINDPDSRANYKLKTKDGNIFAMGLTDSEEVKRSLVSVKERNTLIIPNKNQWSGGCAFLVTKEKNITLGALYKNESPIVEEIPEKQLFIDMINYRVIQSETRLTKKAESQIEALLEMQRQLTEISLKSSGESENITFIKEQLEMTKKETEKYLTREEIEYLCQQEEVTFKQELEEEQHQTQIEIPPKS